ncbi:hypothetical protein V8E54_012447 [Elaphomyces granulatus]
MDIVFLVSKIRSSQSKRVGRFKIKRRVSPLAKSFTSAEPSTDPHFGRAAIVSQFVAVAENINGLQSQKCRQRYQHLFLNLLPDIVSQRNALTHGYFHAFKKVEWSHVWEGWINDLPHLRQLLIDTVNDIKNLQLKDF